jgi:beta-galactosidase
MIRKINRIRRCGLNPSAGKFFLMVFTLFFSSVFAHAVQRPLNDSGQSSASNQSFHGAALVAKDGKLLLNGQPYQVLSGEIHYARIPRAYWRARLKMAKAMGLNTISTYVFWNLHEPKPGVYDFSGNLDVAEFIRIAQQEGLNVILRPGPYACAEWELGGYPAWLLSDPKMVLRSNEPQFMVPAERWMMRLGKELAPLQAGRGGPIVAVQLENEYGSFGSDKAYLEHMRQILLRAGFTNALMYTADGQEQLSDGTLPGVLAVANFSPGAAKDTFDTLEKFEPGMPLMSGEYWVGWYDKWGKKHVVRDQNVIAKEYEWMLNQGYSVNIYMFHGGTSFGFMNGANVDDGTYFPDVTSYDYDAPLDESGRPTPLYYVLRDIITRHDKVTGTPAPPAVPDSPPTISVPQFSLAVSASLWKTLPKPVTVAQPVPMEMLGQSYGYILYRTVIAKPVHGELAFEHIWDYAQIYMNGSLVGTLDRRLHQDRLPLDVQAKNTQLDILVENSGRVNFHRDIRTEWKGIRGSVTLAGNALTGWRIYTLPMTDPNTVPFSNASTDAGTPAAGPTFYRGNFFLQKTGDTFLDMRSMKKGVVWINGHNLGRFWDIGPLQTLYVPGPWLNTGKNTVVVFDLVAQPDSKLSGLSAPLLDGPIRQQ